MRGAEQGLPNFVSGMARSVLISAILAFSIHDKPLSGNGQCMVKAYGQSPSSNAPVLIPAPEKPAWHKTKCISPHSRPALNGNVGGINYLHDNSCCEGGRQRRPQLKDKLLLAGVAIWPNLNANTAWRTPQTPAHADDTSISPITGGQDNTAFLDNIAAPMGAKLNAVTPLSATRWFVRHGENSLRVNPAQHSLLNHNPLKKYFLTGFNRRANPLKNISKLQNNIWPCNAQPESILQHPNGVRC